MVETITFCKLNFIFSKSLKSKQKKLPLTLLYHLSQEITLGDSWNLICIDQSRFYNFLHLRGFQIFNIT